MRRFIKLETHVIATDIIKRVSTVINVEGTHSPETVPLHPRIALNIKYHLEGGNELTQRVEQQLTSQHNKQLHEYIIDGFEELVEHKDAKYESKGYYRSRTIRSHMERVVNNETFKPILLKNMGAFNREWTKINNILVPDNR